MLCHHLQVLHVFSLQVLLKPLSKIWFRLQAKSWLDDINAMYLTFAAWENLPESKKSGRGFHPSQSERAYLSQLRSTIFLLLSDHIEAEILIT